MARRLMALGAIGAALALPAGANAGGWATVGLDSMPEALRATEPWPVELTILQHGRTPLEGVKARVIVTGWGGKLRQAFPARPTGRPGVYRAVVSFRGPGRFGITVDDGFTMVHDFGTVRIGYPRGARPPVDAVQSVTLHGPDGGAGASGSGAGSSDRASGAAARGGGDGPDIALALAAALVAGLAAGAGSFALQRRREGPAAASG